MCVFVVCVVFLWCVFEMVVVCVVCVFVFGLCV